ncbi:MATE family efflux transporter [Pseudenhygromyxa sp. WMMC2535]|uniref:MATE family efflux transporter n=1 Tax=Pseudenhygromyxa sp. WMMC2535 TaxID=2712867 RepID=UPI0015564EB3|nr:MATE family efflux transporter [Pseudenhygromyxa sp. WMMC2535]NVB42816.1 MATE family efflux transporter [Pseudenhygromyxa sp. WMMC2535]
MAKPEARSANLRIWKIAGPAILANSSGPLVGLVDTWAVGHLPAAHSLAAVGLGGVIFNYLLWAFGFLRMGTTGLIAQARGRGEREVELATIVRAAALGLGLGLLLLAAQSVLIRLSLRIMAPPEEVAALTAEYLRVCIWSAPFTLLGYAITGVLFGLERTRAILALQLILNLSNAALNLYFVVGRGMGVAGVAWGTLIAQGITATIGVGLLLRIYGLEDLARALRERATWALAGFRKLAALNGFLFVRTILLMTALAQVMRSAGGLGEAPMAASHVASQYMMLVSLGLDGLAHAAEALAGGAWGRGAREEFRRWVKLTALWSALVALAYALIFWLGGAAITAALTDLEAVRAEFGELLPLIIALPIVAVWCYLFDGVYVGATAGSAMAGTMAVAFVVYLIALGPMTEAWQLKGLWGAVLVFLGARGVAQALWYPRLERSI